MDGVLNLYKPPGPTSSKAIERVRNIIGHPKAGHAGALDPLAEGVLVVCLGRATRLVEAIMDQPKVYRAVVALDRVSPTIDLETPSALCPNAQPPSREHLNAVLRGFEGDIDQLPPASSALKVGGHPAYKLARAGHQPTLSPRRVHVHWVHIHRYEWPRLEFEVACGRGTYIRALVRDLGAHLGVGGCLTALLRRQVGPFRSEEAWTLERLETAHDPEACILPLELARALVTQRPVRIPPRP